MSKFLRTTTVPEKTQYHDMVFENSKAKNSVTNLQL